MGREFLLILGSVVALAIVWAEAELGPGYPRSAQADPIQLQYLPGAGPPEDAGVRRKQTHRGTKVGGRPGARGRPGDPSLFPEGFSGAYEGDSNAVPGEPGVDYPTYSDVPVTSFTCQGKSAGYYADPETRCQTFHVCTPGGSTANSFLCPNGTLFNPAVRTCDWWPAVDCGVSSDSLRISQDIGKVKSVTPPGGPRAASPTQRKEKRPAATQFRRPSHHDGLPKQETIAGSTEGLRHRETVKYADPRSPQPFESTNRVEKPFPHQEPRPTSPGQAADVRGSARRRPKPFSGSHRKQQTRVTSPATPQIAYYKEGEVHQEEQFSNPTTSRTTQAARREKPRSHTITRFDFTRETLEFPSMRTTPTRPTYAFQNENLKSFEKDAAASVPIRTASSTFDRPSYATKELGRLPQVQSSTTNAPTYTERRPYRASRLVTQAPTFTKQPILNQRETVRITAPNPPTVSFRNENSLTSPGRPIHVTQRIQPGSTVTTPRGDHFFDLTKTSRQPFRSVVTTEAPVREEIFRPIVVTPPGHDYGSLAQSFSQSNSEFSGAVDTGEIYRPFTTDGAQSFALSQPISEDIPDNRIENRPVTPTIIQPFYPTHGTHKETQYTNEGRVPLATENAETLDPTQVTVTGTQYRNGGGESTITGNTQTFTASKEGFTGTYFTNQNHVPAVTGYTQSFTPTKGTVTVTEHANEEHVHSVTENTQTFAPTQGTVTGAQRSNEGRVDSVTGNTNTFTPTQGTVTGTGNTQTFVPTLGAFAGTYNSNQVRVPLTTGNTRTFAPTQGTVTGRHSTGEGPVHSVTGNTQTIAPTLGTATGRHSTSEGRANSATGYTETFAPTQGTVTGRHSAREGPVHSVTGNTQTIAPTLGTATGRHSTSEGRANSAIGYTETFAPTQGTVTGRHSAREGPVHSVTGNTQTIAPTQGTVTGRHSTSEGRVNSITGNTETFAPTKETVTGSHSTSKGPVHSVAGNAQTFAPTQATVTDAQHANEHFPTVTGNVQTSAPTQKIFTGPQHASEEQSSFATGNAQAFILNQVASSGSQYNSEGHRPTLSGDIEPLTPTQGTLKGPQQANERHRPSVTGIAHSTAQSQATSTDALDTKHIYNTGVRGNAHPIPTFHTIPTASLDKKQESRSSVRGTAQSFAQSIATSQNVFDKKQEYNPFAAGYAQSFSGSQATSTGGFDHNDAYRLLSGFAQSFANADTFVSDEGFSRPALVSTTSSLKPASFPTTAIPARSVTVVTTTTTRATPTTPKLVYTPTVPQTTARPTTTTTPAPKKTSFIPITMTFVPRTTAYVHKTTAYAPRPTISVPHNEYIPSLSLNTAGATSTTIKPFSTTKKPKGFYITYAPPTRHTTPKPHFQKEEKPMYNSFPKVEYLPNAPEAPKVTTVPPTPLYQSTRPSIPDSYFRSKPPTSQTTYSTASTSESPFAVKSISHSFDGSGFRLNPQSSIEYQPIYPTIYGVPQQSPLQDDNRSNSNRVKVAKGQTHSVTSTTEPSFVIQKSVELFAAHEVAYHPSVFSQSSYSPSSQQDDYRTGGDKRPELQPPPFLVPSPDARGFGRWNTEGEDDKLSKYNKLSKS